MKKAIAEVEAKANKILENRKAELADIENLIETAKQQKDEAESRMKGATNNSDIGAYQAAKQIRNDAEDAIEMYSNRLEILKGEPLITEKDYKDGIAVIIKTLETVSAVARNDLVKCVEEIKKIAESAMKEIEDGNEVLSKWQHKIYQDNCLERSAKGSEYHNPRLEKRYEDWAIGWFLDHIVKSEQYRSIANK